MSFSSATAEARKTKGSAATMGKLFIGGEMTKQRKDSDFLIRNGGRRKDYGLYSNNGKTLHRRRNSERIVTFSSATAEG